VSTSGASLAGVRGLVRGGATVSRGPTGPPAAPRRRVEGTLAVSFAALVVAGLALFLTAEALRVDGVPFAGRPLVAVLLALLVILVVGIVDLQLAAARRRAQARDGRLRDAVARLDGVHGFAHTLAVALGQVRDLLAARDAMLATHELETGRAFLWALPGGRARGERAAFSDLEAERRDEYLFAMAADAWLAERKADGRWAVLALGAEGLRLKGETVPAAALEPLSRRLGTDRFAAVDVKRGGEWEGRIIVADPGRGPRPEESLRLAQRFVHEMTGAVQSRFLLGRVRGRVGAMERGRIARDLHDSTMTPNVAPDSCKAVSLLNKSTFDGKKKASDPAFNLAAQLVAAELNYAAGAGKKPAVTTAIQQAVLLLGKYKFNGLTHDTISAADATTMNNLAKILDDYNNNRP